MQNRLFQNASSRRFFLAAILVLVLASCGPTGSHADRVGLYIWGALPASPEPLVAAEEDAKSLGVRIIRTCMAPYWDPRPAASDTLLPLDQKVRRPDYDRLLRNFPVVMITAYDAASYDPVTKAPRYRRTGPMPIDERNAMLGAVRREFERFALELSKLPGTFIVSNWEAENDSTDETWEFYLRYLQARLDGIAAGRRRALHLGYPAHVFSAVEFMHVRPGWTDPRSATPPRKASGLAAAFRLTDVDYLSYSAWDSIFHTPNRSYTPARLREAFADIREQCAETCNPCRLIIGEAGYLRDYDSDNWNLEAVLTECLRSGAAYVINWLEYDQPGQVDAYGFNADQSRFGKFDLQRKVTFQGLFLKDFLSSTVKW